MTRSRVFIMRSRSDQNREIESRDDNVSVHNHTQSRKETEFFELMDGYFRSRRDAFLRNVVMLLSRAPRVIESRPISRNRCVLAVARTRFSVACVAEQMRLSTSGLKALRFSRRKSVAAKATGHAEVGEAASKTVASAMRRRKRR